MQIEVVKETTTKGICEESDSLYMAKSDTNKLLLKSRLYDLRLEEGKSLKPHLEEFYFIVMDLQKIEVKLDDEDLDIYLLCYLPPPHKNFRETLFHSTDDGATNGTSNADTSYDLIVIMVVSW